MDETKIWIILAVVAAMLLFSLVVLGTTRADSERQLDQLEGQLETARTELAKAKAEISASRANIERAQNTAQQLTDQLGELGSGSEEIDRLIAAIRRDVERIATILAGPETTSPSPTGVDGNGL